LKFSWRILAAYACSFIKLGSIYHLPESAGRYSRQVVVMNAPKQQCAKWPTPKQRIDQQHNLPRRPDVRSLQVGN
jgi:hypothetical protein